MKVIQAFDPKEASAAMKYVIESIEKLNHTVKASRLQFICFNKPCLMPWKRNNRKRQMMRACDMIMRGHKEGQ